MLWYRRTGGQKEGRGLRAADTRGVNNLHCLWSAFPPLGTASRPRKVARNLPFHADVCFTALCPLSFA